MQRCIALIFLVLISAKPASAGPWPREKGQLFIAAAGNFWLSDGARLPVHYDPTLYAEYGLTERVSVGVDLYTADAGRIGSAFVFASVPLNAPDARHKFSASLAFGRRVDSFRKSETLMRAGLSWGYGFDQGWFAIDTSATYSTADETFRPKADITFGYRWTDKWMSILQLQTGQGNSDDYYAKIVPSVTYSLRDNIQLQLAAVQALTGDKGLGVKLETWLTF